jgi:hypothetical protein
VGEVNDRQKRDFLGNAAVPVVSDRLAGTVWSAHDRGDGLRDPRHRVAAWIDTGSHRRWCDGFVVDSEAEAVDAIGHIPHLDRGRIRQRFEQRFTARRMAEEYVESYRRLTAAHSAGAIGGCQINAGLLS